MDVNKINIAGVDKYKLLKALWMHSKYAKFFELENAPLPFFPDKNIVIKYLSENTFIEYFAGKIIKIDLSNDIVDYTFYDRKYGKGAFQKIFNDMMNESKYF